MKIIATLILACSTFLAYGAEHKTNADAVVVSVLARPLPGKEDEKEKYLWEQVTFKSDAQFDSCTTKNWKDNFSAFAKSLVEKAENQKLDSASLSKVLDLVLADSKDEIVYLPIGAHQTTMDGALVWIIAVKWEHPLLGENVALGHSRTFAFDQKTLKQVGFVTCN